MNHQNIAKNAMIGIIGIGTSALIAIASSAAQASHVAGNGDSTESRGPSELVLPIMNARQGKAVFVNKGCVACHAINGVGGHDAPPMNAHKKMGRVNPFDFAAKMWNHAPGMIAAQEGAFGEHITITGPELANLIAFVHDDKAQHQFSEKDLTAKARKMMNHEHGGQAAPEAHEEEVGHGHGADSKPHKD